MSAHRKVGYELWFIDGDEKFFTPERKVRKEFISLSFAFFAIFSVFYTLISLTILRKVVQ